MDQQLIASSATDDRKSARMYPLIVIKSTNRSACKNAGVAVITSQHSVESS